MKKIILIENDEIQLNLLDKLVKQMVPIDEKSHYSIESILFKTDNDVLNALEKIINSSSEYDMFHIIVDILLTEEEETQSTINFTAQLYSNVSSGMSLANKIKSRYYEIFGKRLAISLMSNFVIVNQAEVKKMQGYPSDIEMGENEFHYIRKPIKHIGEEYSITVEESFGFIDWKLFESTPQKRTKKFSEAFGNVALIILDLLEERTNDL